MSDCAISYMLSIVGGIKNDMETTKNNRFANLDLLRTLAIILVALNHACHLAWDFYAAPSQAFLQQTGLGQVMQLSLIHI